MHDLQSNAFIKLLHSPLNSLSITFMNSFRDMKYSQPGYNDEFIGLYHVCFDDKDKLDISLVNGERGIGPLQHYQHDVGIGYRLLIFIIKWLYYETSVISKGLFIYLKTLIFNIRNIRITIMHSNHRYILGEPSVPL